MSLALCILAFLVAAYAARRSLVGGLVVALAVGYFYGILRANLNEVMSHFIFDGAVIGLYLGRLRAVRDSSTFVNTKLVQPWLIALIAWPLFLTFLPIQDPMIQLVGLRGNMFFLPMVLLGAQMEPEERITLAYYVAILNLIVFAFALGEFSYGVQVFYPRNEVTELIFRSRTDELGRSFRIPATFTGSHAFAGTMVATLPLLVGSWASRAFRGIKLYIVVSGLGVAVLGVFMGASRTHAIVLFLLIIVGTLSFQMRPAMLGMWISIILIIGWLVFEDPRLQRFRTLQDTEYVTARIGTSVNASFLTAITDYPMGNGIGGGGTSIPFFLFDRISNPVLIENEFARIQLELGLPGLIIWVMFVGWVILFGIRRVWLDRDLGRRLAYVMVAATFVTGLTGTGLLTAIPQSLLIMFFSGWIVREESRLIAPITLTTGTIPSNSVPEFGAVPR